jgi:hypothetical protein
MSEPKSRRELAIKRGTRDVVFLVAGLIGFLHEVFLVHGPFERPVITGASLALMGVPLFLRADEGSNK